MIWLTEILPFRSFASGNRSKISHRRRRERKGGAELKTFWKEVTYA